jgi:DNA-binding MarR family transcriptional regulator
MSREPVGEKTSGGQRIEEIAQLLFGVTEQMRQNFEEICERFDLTPPQARALLILDEKAPMKSLADVLRCDASNVTGITDRLEARGLVRRESTKGDRRVRLLALTPRGKRLRRQLQDSIETNSPVTAGLSPMERETLRELLAKLVEDAHGPSQSEKGSSS